MLRCLSADRMSFSADVWSVAGPLTQPYIAFSPHAPRKRARNTIQLNHRLLFFLFFFSPSPSPSHFRLSAYRTLISLLSFLHSPSPSLYPFVCPELTISWVEAKVRGSFRDVCHPSSPRETERTELERCCNSGNAAWQDGLQCESITFSHTHACTHTHTHTHTHTFSSYRKEK